MALIQKTRLAEIEILDSGRIQFREETQIFDDDTPISSPTYHRSGVDPGFLDEGGNLLPMPLPEPPVTLGLNTSMNLQGILDAVRTPAVMEKWKQKLLAEREESLRKEAQRKAQEEAAIAAQTAEAARIAALVQAELDKRQA